MSLFGLYKNAHRPPPRGDRGRAVRQPVPLHRLPPIVAAAQAMYDGAPRPPAGVRRAWPPTAVARDLAGRGELAASIASLARDATLEYEAAGRRWWAPRTRRRAGRRARRASGRAHRRRRDRRRPLDHQASARHRRHRLHRRRRRTRGAFGDGARTSEIGAAATLADAFAALDATGRSCTRRGRGSRRCRSATAARSAATSPTARRSATRCRR